MMEARCISDLLRNPRMKNYPDNSNDIKIAAALRVGQRDFSF